MKLKNKIVLITGGTSGIGKVAAIAIAKEGATLVLTARDMKKGEKVKAEIIELTKNKKIDVMHCDLSSFASITKFCSDFRKKYDHLHLLINNAGTWLPKRELSADGIELIFATNHLGHFLLTNLLLDLVKKSEPARIIVTSSGLHKRETLLFEDLEGKQKFNGMRAYGRSKLANLMFSRSLAAKLKGTQVTVNSFSPGLTYTGLFRNANLFTKLLMKIIAKKVEIGAETLIYLAVSDEVANVNGEYFQNKKPVSSSEESRDMKISNRLWKVSEKYVKDYL